MVMKLCAFADEADSRLEGQISALKENGISLLEIRGVDGQNVSDLTTAEAKAIKERLDEAGIRVWAIGSPVGKIGVREPFGPHLDSFRRLLETAVVLEAPNLRLFSFYLPESEPPAVCRDEVFDRLSKLCEAAQGSGVRLCHENEKGIYGALAPECAEIHRTLPALRAVFDPANFIQCGQDVLEAWKLLEPYVAYLHVKDATAAGKVVPAGKGIGRLPEILSRYAAFGGEVATLEPHLTVFDGFAALERPDERHDTDDYAYPTARAAFDAAAAALRGLLDEE